MIQFALIGLREVQAKLQRMSPALQDKLRPYMAQATIGLQAAVKANIADRFKSVGPLYKSVQSQLSESVGRLVGRVFTRDIPYAAIQEYGGTTPAHLILPVNGSALAFRVPGKLGFSGGATGNPLVIVRAVHHPGSRIPERSYARLALIHERSGFEGGIREIVARQVRAP